MGHNWLGSGKGKEPRVGRGFSGAEVQCTEKNRAESRARTIGWEGHAFGKRSQNTRMREEQLEGMPREKWSYRKKKRL